jgi:hypothetical protein
MKILKSVGQNLSRAAKRVKAKFSFGKSNKVSDGPAPTPNKHAPDGNMQTIKDKFPDTDPDTILHIQKMQASTTYPDGTVHTVEVSLIKRIAAEPKAAGPATQFVAEHPQNAAPNALVDALKKSNSKAGMQTKAMAVQSFIVVGLVTGGLAYFFISAQERKKCIDEVFVRYPMFQSQKLLEQKMRTLGAKCATEQSELCASINGAYAALEACDNTLLRNIVGEMLNIAGDGVDWALDQAESGVGFLGDVFKDMFAKVWPALIAVGVLLVLGLGAFLVKRSWGKRAAPAATFGRATRATRCIGHRGSLRRRFS